MDIPPEVIVDFSPVVMVPLIAGIVQVAVNTGMQVHLTSLVALVTGVVLGVGTAVTAGTPMFIGLIQGAVMGLAASGLWMQFSRRIDTNGAPHE